MRPAIIALGICALVSCPAPGIVFRALPDLPGGATESRAWGISRDGSVIVGSGTDPYGAAAARWTLTGVESIEPGPGGQRPYTALAASADGRFITGVMGPGTHAYVWRADAPAGTRTRALPTLPGSAIDATRASDIDDAGRFVVGSAHAPQSTPMSPRVRAVYWDLLPSAPEIHALAEPGTPALPVSSAAAISGDGSTVAGDGRGPSAIVPFVAHRDSSVLTSLQLTLTATGDGITAVSRDGGTIVGAIARRAFRYDGQLELLEVPGAGWVTSAAAACDDGSIVVGSAQPVDFARAVAVMWDRDGRIRRLDDLLTTDLGVDLAGWSLIAATAISGDGRTIAGYGLNPLGQTQAFAVQLPSPASGAWLVMLAAMARGRRRRR